MAITKRTRTELTCRDGTRLSVVFEGPEAPDAVLVIGHGVCEHRGRYAWFIERCCEQRLGCLSFDLRGHGASTGTRGHIERFNEYVEDLRAVTAYRDEISERFGVPRRFFLFGHSLGGVIVARYLEEYGENSGYEGAILSSPGFVPAVGIPKYKRLLAALLTPVFPRLRLPTGIGATLLSSDVAEQQAYTTDPNVFSRVSLRWFAEFERAGQVALERANAVTLPLYVVYGGADRVVSTRAIERFTATTRTSENVTRCWPDLRHELLHERLEVRARVTSELFDWIRIRLDA